jgi:type VI secretion system secreted protein VgrG
MAANVQADRARYLQADRPLTVTTPLGPDDLLLIGFRGREAISRPFEFRLDVLAENATSIPFDRLLGQKVTVHLTTLDGKRRHFSGICSRMVQGKRDLTFTEFEMRVVPSLWLLSRRAQSRIFQQVSVPEILKQVLAGLDVTYELVGKYLPRNYCVQYRETDLAFASRLMEEEGIYYFFRHSENGHTMVVADSPRSHPDVPHTAVVNFVPDQDGPDGVARGGDQATTAVTFGASEQGLHGEDRISSWEKVQSLRSGKFTLRDHCFELPDNKLEAGAAITERVAAGQVEHKLHVANNEKLEVYDYPGGYAHRFDGVDPGGGDRPADVQHIFEDNKRTVGLRMQEEAAAAMKIRGTGTCRQFVSGYKFVFAKHFNADGRYVITAVRHDASLAGNYRSGQGTAELVYSNEFTCIPFDLPFRPARRTPKPVVQGTQTAVVVGPKGEEIFTDKYGRVKVQFFWDRQGKNDGNSSCWVRVGTPWAGERWGMIHIPRIGQEVIVDFQCGDPDEPIIIGSVYNFAKMPPYELPANKTQSGIKSRSTQGGTPEHFNELRFEDKKDSEDVYFHAQKDFHRVVENDDDLKVGNDQTITIKNNRTEEVQQGDEKVTIKQGNRNVEISMGNESLAIKMGNQTTKIDLGKSETEALQSIELKVGQSSVKLDQMGVTIKGMMISVEGQVQTQVKGLMTQVTADAMLQLKGGITMIG